MIGAVLLLANVAPAPATRCVDAVVVPVAGNRAVDAPGQVQAIVSEAFRRACADGLLEEPSIITQGTASDRRLHLHNLPDGNVATFSADQRPDGDWRLILEYPFAGSDGTQSLPTVEQLHEAIYCAVRGATKQEQATSGRCLAD